jgi:hypothetical protein
VVSTADGRDSTTLVLTHLKGKQRPRKSFDKVNQIIKARQVIYKVKQAQLHKERASINKHAFKKEQAEEISDLQTSYLRGLLKHKCQELPPNAPLTQLH